MADKVRDVMTADPVTLDEKTKVTEAANEMRDEDIGDVILVKNGEVSGILTDRDIVIRCVADGKDCESTPVGEIASKDLVTIDANADLDDAVRLMREHKVRRLVVVEGKKPVGVVSIGDLAVERDRRSALGEISAAPPNQ